MNSVKSVKSVKRCPSNGVNHFIADAAGFVHTLAIIAVVIGVLLVVAAIMDERGVFGYRLPYGWGRAWAKYGVGAAVVGLVFLIFLLPNFDTCPIPF